MGKALSFLFLLALASRSLAMDPAAIGPAPTMPTALATPSPTPAKSATPTPTPTPAPSATPSATPSSSGPSISAQFSDTGLSALTYNGAQILASGVPTLSWIGLIQSNGNSLSASTTPTASAFNTTTKTLTQSYPWGAITIVYSTTPTQLFADVTVQNTTSTPMGQFILQLANLKFPSTPAEYDGSDPMMGWNMGSPTVLPFSWGANRLVITDEDVTDPLMVGLPWSTDSAKTTFPLFVYTGQDWMLPSSYPFVNWQVPANGSVEFKIGFRFGPSATPTAIIASDVFQAFSTAYPATLQWTDHRPIAQLMLANQNGSYATNPRCWFGDASVDTTSTNGIAAFQQRVLAYAQQAVTICKAENAQAAITWDIEGEQFAQPTTYIGDPRLIDTLDPEMSGVVDAYFKTFTNAGIRVGMTIRPQQLVLTDSNTGATQTEVADPGQLMLQKMTYAYNRWGATVFYVDSNGAPDDPIDPKFFREVAAALPNVLMIPEHSNLGYYAITAPYGQLNMGVTGTPANVVQVYPGAFSVFTITDGDVTDNLSTLIQSVTRGDSIFFRGWFNATENAQVTQIYGAAK